MTNPAPRPTLFDAFLESYKNYKHQTAFIYRVGDEQFEVSYAKLFEDALLLAKAFRGQGIVKGDKVFLLSDNRYAWIVTDLALMALGAVSVPRGSDTPSSELAYILDHSECAYLILETEGLFNQHRELIEQRALQGVFVIASEHPAEPGMLTYSQLLANRSLSLEDLRQLMQVKRQVGGDDLVTIIYTSGTTGTPKGVKLTHANIMHNVQNLPDLIRLTSEDRWLSILPTWHIFERTVEYVALSRGSCIVYSSIRTFAADLERFKPTLVATVPRIWESLYGKVNAALKKESPRKARLFQFLVSVSSSFRLNSRRISGRLPRFEHEPWWRVLPRKARALACVVALAPLYAVARAKLAPVKKKFGGRLRLAISGGGSLPPFLDEWIDAIGIRITNAYGMTECSPGIAGRGLDCRTFGTLGPPFPYTEVRIAGQDDIEVPTGTEGEIQVRGPQVFHGYYHNNEANAESFTPDGFFRTGDLGKKTLNGELVITGRAKEIIVLASGENIDPTNIEATISTFPFVQDAVLVGQDKKGLGALIVPDLEKLRQYVAEQYNHVVNEAGDVLQDKQIVESLKREMNKLLKPKRGFKPYEKLHSIHFLNREFKLGEELTNTLKKKRHVIEQKYQDIINRLLK
ncbi:AMP-dependent synthetase/ligase [Desulfohalobium retbaense]|uniref:AMP-dependent synthetase and ligase n=1 Tax=Desulfohalobium retbaense (strain ATCC 49708 / DSM 5692 / JCM 16813 / HR100) TaxID=485915 RepID=C8WZ69_DESRD|nr:long-chain fatty acid--CoA ligase [Desulfohalobium retbaense]ACV67344.1 AMP-dependent synthetase and ligase [Desulfohalobium retbaense DSM 5692]